MKLFIITQMMNTHRGLCIYCGTGIIRGQKQGGVSVGPTPGWSCYH